MAWNPNVPTVTNRVQDDLTAMRENFQHLDPLAQAVDELQIVSGLAPYVQAILDSRIVDHNLDVSNPANGWYVRWENGLQIVWATRGDAISGATFTNLGSISLPAAFVDANYAIVAGYHNAGYRLVFSRWGKTATGIAPQIYNFDTDVTANWWYAAIGRWA